MSNIENRIENLIARFEKMNSQNETNLQLLETGKKNLEVAKQKLEKKEKEFREKLNHDLDYDDCIRQINRSISNFNEIKKLLDKASLPVKQYFKCVYCFKVDNKYREFNKELFYKLYFNNGANYTEDHVKHTSGFTPKYNYYEGYSNKEIHTFLGERFIITGNKGLMFENEFAHFNLFNNYLDDMLMAALINDNDAEIERINKIEEDKFNKQSAIFWNQQ